MPAPSATGRIVVAAPPEKVYTLVSDPGALAGLAEEYSGHRWLGDVRSPAVGARFRGSNRRGLRRWSTISTVTDADEGRRFGFEVTYLGLPIARWQYDIEPDGEGSAVTESTWERRSAWLKVPTSLATGVWKREVTNHENIATTLTRLKAAAEAS